MGGAAVMVLYGVMFFAVHVLAIGLLVGLALGASALVSSLGGRVR